VQALYLFCREYRYVILEDRVMVVYLSHLLSRNCQYQNLFKHILCKFWLNSFLMSELLFAVKIDVFRHLTPCNFVDMHQRFGETSCLPFHAETFPFVRSFFSSSFKALTGPWPPILVSYSFYTHMVGLIG
jgi:hypothetical protein